jgi:hypothetical protein
VDKLAKKTDQARFIDTVITYAERLAQNSFPRLEVLIEQDDRGKFHSTTIRARQVQIVKKSKS